MKRLEYIDALRGWAILGVLAAHANQNMGTLSDNLSASIEYGPMGVRLFFLISALTIFITLDKKKEIKEERVNFFFLKRFLRIAPMYYLAILYYSIINLIFYQHIDFKGLFSNLFFVHGLSPETINTYVPGGWSITVEMFFYCLIPFIIRRINNLNQALSFLILSYIFRFVGIYIVRRLIGNEGINGEFLYLFFPNQLPIFAVGIVLYFVIIKKEKIEISPINLISFAILMLISLFFKYYNLVFDGAQMFAYTFFILTVFMSKKKTILLDNYIIRWIGKISFSIYIIHFIVIFWLMRFNFNKLYSGSPDINFLLFFTLVLILSSIISYLSYQFIEKPFQNLGKKLISRKEKPIFDK